MDSQQIPKTRDDVKQIVLFYVSEFFFVEKKNVTESTIFEEDLSADAFTYADCLDALEEEFTERKIGYYLDQNERAECETVGELIDAIFERVLVSNERPA